MSNHGGVRVGAGAPHIHKEYVLVVVCDDYPLIADRNVILVGEYLARDGSRPSEKTMIRARDIAQHYVGEQAQSVKIIKRFCCSPGLNADDGAEIIEIVK